jgi:serpin B
MKKTSLFDGPAIVFRKLRGLAAAACAATALLSALPLTAHADDAIADRKAIAANMNRKGFDLFKLVSGKDTKENSFISPYSIDSAFGLVYCGAKERTAQEIRDTLGLPADPAECGKFFHEVSQEYAANKLIEVLVSNSVWYEQKYEKAILPSFFAMIEKYYDGTFYKENFRKPGPLVSKVNAYVEDHTKNMIKDLLSPDDISPKSFMILLNTLFFEAKWKTPFKKDDTKPMIFRNFDGKEKRVKMMYRRGFDIGYYSSEEDNVHAVVLPYEDTRFDLVALMPIQPGADRGEAAMNNIISKIGEKLDTWLKNRSQYETRLWLPIVDLTCKYSLKDDLGELGMTTPFHETQANFHGIAEPPKDRPATENDLVYIWIEKVIHKTALKMDEEKTQAAAATAIIMGGFGGGFSQPPPVNIFRADRPYLVLIRDNQTGLILFAGRINDPGVYATEADGPVTPSFEGMPFPGFGMPPMQRSNGGFGPPVEGPARTTVPGAKPADQTIPRQVTTTAKPGTTTQKGESAAAKVDGQISVILEGWIDGEDAFVFRDGKVSLQHKSFKTPYEVTVNGKPWTDLSKPFELGFTPDPAATKFACEGRGQKSMTRTNDSVTVTIYDQQGAAACYRIILFQPSGVKNPLALPNNPLDKTVMEIPTGSQLASQAVPRQKTPAVKPQQTAAIPESGVMVLEGTFEGRGVFLFMSNLIAYSHKDGEYPKNVKVNGKPWADLTQPLMLDAATIPARIIRKQARGTVTLLPAEDFARLELDDHQDNSASYRIEFGTK